MNVPSAFKNLGHFIAAGAKKFCSFVKNDLDPALAKIEASKDTVEAITRVVYPQAVAIEDAAYFCLGVIGQAIDGIADATAANGVNVQLDQAAIEKIKAAVSIAKGTVKGAPAPAVTVTAQDIAAATVAGATA